MINGQFPGPQIDAVTNENLIISVYNYLTEPFLISWYVLYYYYYYNFLELFAIINMFEKMPDLLRNLCLKVSLFFVFSTKQIYIYFLFFIITLDHMTSFFLLQVQFFSSYLEYKGVYEIKNKHNINLTYWI